MAEKKFLIRNIPKLGQSVVTSPELGRILHRPEIEDIIAGFGSTVKKSPLEVYIEIVPPITKAQLPKLGDALVQLAHSLDPSDPQAEYSID
jgi:hypothetical protein